MIYQPVFLFIGHAMAYKTSSALLNTLRLEGVFHETI